MAWPEASAPGRPASPRASETPPDAPAPCVATPTPTPSGSVEARVLSERSAAPLPPAPARVVGRELPTLEGAELPERGDGRAEWQGVLVAVPAFNEERFIGSVVLETRLAGLPVLVVDDGSSDRTAEIARAAGAVVERHRTNGGKAAALTTAFQYARRAGANVLVVLDGDGQHDPREIERLIQPILAGSADISIGSRFLPESEGRIPLLRRLGQRLMTMAANLGSGTAVTDSQSGFRAFSRRAIEALHFGARGFSVEVEMQFRAREHGLRVVEVPITAIYRDPPRRNVLRHGTMVLNGMLQLVERHRPLLFFGGPGLVSLAGGLGLGVLVVDIFQRSRELAVGYALITVLLTLIGLLAIFTGLLLHSMRSSFLDLEQRLALLGQLIVGEEKREG